MLALCAFLFTETSSHCIVKSNLKTLELDLAGVSSWEYECSAVGRISVVATLWKQLGRGCSKVKGNDSIEVLLGEVINHKSSMLVGW